MYSDSSDNYYSKLLKDKFIKTNSDFSYETYVTNTDGVPSIVEFNELKEEVEHLRNIIKKLVPEEFI